MRPILRKFLPEGDRIAFDEYVRGLTVPPLKWDPSARVNDDTGTATQDRPALALAADGSAWAVFEDARLSGTGDIFVSRRDPVTGRWGPNERVTPPMDGTVAAPSVAVDAAGAVHVVWQLVHPGVSGLGTDLYYARRDPTTGTWSAPL